MGRKKKDSPDEYDLSLLSGKQYSKSNSLINAKGKASLLAQKLFAIGIQQAEEDEKGILTATIRGTDLRKIFGNKNGSFYDEIKALVEPIKGRPSILDWRVIYTDDTTKSIEAMNVITDCKFEEGILSFRFNDKVNDQVKELKSNYTIFSLTETIPLRSIYSFRIFELLKAEYDIQEWRAKKEGTYNPGDVYVLDVNLTDLKLKLGIIDPNTSEKLLRAVKQETPDYEAIEEMAKGQKENVKYKRFSDFRVATIDVAQQELKERTSIFFEYEQLKAGRGGKTVGIRFYIHSKQTEADPEEIVETVPVEEKELSEAEKYTIVFQAQVILGTQLYTMEDILSIVKAADYDLDKIRAAHKLINKTKTQIDNPTGWMIEAIKKSYKENTPKKAANNFNNFQQNTYDFNELEKQLLDN